MDNIITAFGMAWGNFLCIPCPIRRWDDRLRNLMLAFLPVVGLIVGLLWFLLGLIFNALHFPAFLSALLMTVYIYGISGFAHIRGFGNCSDAIIARGQKKRGAGTSAFSIIAMAVLAVLMFIFLMALMRKTITASRILALIAIPIISRAEAGDSILKFNRRLAAESGSDQSGGSGKFVLISSLITGVLLIIVMLGFRNPTAIKAIRPFVFSCIVTLVVSVLASSLGRNSLREMSGDAASFSICLSELLGVLALVFGTVG